MANIWKECVACHSPTLPADLTRRTPQGMAHEDCDEPTYQKCAGCGDPVHLNHVEYDAAENDMVDAGGRYTPWCPTCYGQKMMAHYLGPEPRKTGY